MQQSSTTPKNRDVGIGLRKIVGCSQSSSQCLLVSIVVGTVLSLHPTMSFILFSLIFNAGLAFDTMRAARSYTHVRTYVRACVLRRYARPRP